ncbi:MAG: hypothetical protein HY059_22875 [Proteobacteria bacterium]|nr:hypothetical protein [Pseudomonadota bacterium]
MSRLHLLAGWFVVFSCSNARAGTYDVQPTQPSVAAPTSAPAEVEFVAVEAKDLKDAVRKGTVADVTLRHRVDKLFDQMGNAEQVQVRPYTMVSEWQRQVFDHADMRVRQLDQRTGTVDGMINAFYHNTLATNDVPLPIIKDIAQEDAMIRAMRRDSKVGFDGQGLLGRGTLGAYVYMPEKREALGIVLHDDLRTVAAYLGDTLAGMTVVAHEGGHALRDAHVGLSPKHSIKDEVDAFNRQADALIAWDRDGKGHQGHRLARFWALYVEGRATAPEVVGQVVKHLAMMRAARENNKMEEFVKSLGYRDHSATAERLNAERVGNHAAAEHAEHAGICNHH